MYRSESRTDKSADRLLLTVMALAIVLAMAALGIVYLAVWSSAADDLTRLLPASTRSYAAAPAPWAAITRTLRQPMWRDREALTAEVLRDGYLAGERVGEIAGLPVESVREIARTMQGIELALVPTSEGDTVLVFVHFRDGTQRKRILGRLAPLLETVDRRVGFRIDKVKERPWQSLVGGTVEPPRVVDMEPWIIFSWGSPLGLEDLLEARVEGRGDALARRQGFAPERASGDGDFKLAVDASSAWRLFAKSPEPPPGGLFEYLDLLTFGAHSDDDGDLLRVRADISDRDLARTLQQGLAPAPHELAALAPSDALSVVSATGNDLTALIGVLRGLAFRLQRDLGTSAATQALTSSLLSATTDLGTEAGEIALVSLEDEDGAPSSLVLLRTSAPEALAVRLAASIPARLGDGYAHGEVLHRGGVLHLELPHDAEGVGLAWRVRAGVLEMAPSVAILDRFADAPERLGDTPRLAMARRGLPREAGLMLIADARLVSRLDVPVLKLLSDHLSPDFSFGITLDALDDHLALRSNLGLWTLATVIASGDRKEIDSFTLAGLEPRCREAYDAFCAVYPGAVPCRPFTLGRRAGIEAVCKALFERSP